MVHSSPLPDITLPGTAFDRMVPTNVALPAITEIDTGRTVTYGELAELANAAAARLRSRGVGPGCVVELRLSNSIDFAVALLAVARTGAAAALIGPSLIDAEASRLSSVAGTTHRVEPGDLAPGPGAAFDPADPDWVAAIPFSSGTTGLAKGVELTHRSIAANAAQFNAALAASGIGEGTRVAAPLPFSHIYGLNTLLLSSLAARRHVFTAARFDLAAFAAAHRNHGIELSYIAPPIALALANSPNVDPADFATTAHMVCGAAPLSESVARRVEERLGVVVLQGYGTTESSPVTHVGIAGRSNPGTIGFALPNTQFRIVDVDTGAEVPDGTAGELQVQGPQVMRGYVDNPTATQTAITDGWLRTGDIARVNPDETVTVVDRAKDVFKYHGFQVAPAELEALLLTHPLVDDVAVAERGGVPKAFVVKQDGLDEATVMAWVAQRVTAYKKVRAVEFVAEIPRNAAGKILRKDL
ncbi:AMP-binding protein [Corynebacterium sp. zg912]|uniref:AMP-binding protein n=1 Tax=Corynebacterium wankanglinii TaxID=2735136 RepID=A0A7V8UVE6_9CORY|nr:MULTISPECIES: AMP-binding protein [Corynebacterium]MBA1837970.1 AMP-binding protein [Corynebacterium wankanglinii]MCR5929256.1 AMP-binding protein [Corynebacterium sp. zg912]